MRCAHGSGQWGCRAGAFAEPGLSSAGSLWSWQDHWLFLRVFLPSDWALQVQVCHRCHPSEWAAVQWVPARTSFSPHPHRHLPPAVGWPVLPAPPSCPLFTHV